jgi:hypothetical protein
MNERGEYRPKVIVTDFEGTGDPLLIAGKQAAVEQKIEAAVDRLKGPRGDDIYKAARAFIEAAEVLDPKRIIDVNERRLNIERAAFGISMGLNSDDPEIRRLGADSSLIPLIERAKNQTKRKYLETNLLPIWYSVHGLKYPTED